MSYQSFLNFHEKIKVLKVKKNDCLYLETAALRINQNKIDINDFIKNHVEKINVLSDLKHRHDQALHPSWPISFNPNENSLKHELVVVKSKPFNHIRATLHKKTFIDEEDLKQLFCLINEKNIFPYTTLAHSPYLYFSFFELKKQALQAFEKVYEINYILEAFQK